MTDEQTLTDRQRRVVDDVAAALGVPARDLDRETDLVDAGLDSVRMMSLLEKWRIEGAEHLDLPTLAADPVLGSWLEVLA